MASHRIGGMSTWSEKIRSLEARGWSLAGLSREVLLSSQSLSDIKQGRTKEPTGMAAVRLHNLYSTGAKPSKSSAKAA